MTLALRLVVVVQKGGHAQGLLDLGGATATHLGRSGLTVHQAEPAARVGLTPGLNDRFWPEADIGLPRCTTS